MTKRMALGAVLAVAAVAGSAWADLADVELTDGQVLFGQVTTTATGYRVALPGGGTTNLARTQVREVRKYESAEQAYAAKSAALPADDVRGHFELALWTCDQGMLDQMARHAQAVLAAVPEHSAARLLLLIHRRGITEPPPPPPPNGDEEENGKIVPTELPTLTDRDVNVIRVCEVRPGEQVRLTFRPNVLDDYWKQMAENNPARATPAERTSFMRQPPHLQLKDMMDNTVEDRLPQLADVVTINQDPQALAAWKRPIQLWVMNSCATSQCHGGADAAKTWRVNNVRNPDDRVSYTNFYILSQYQGPRGGRLIDRGYPTESLLLQYALPPEQAAKAHPPVDGKPIPVALRGGAADPMYRDLLIWIRDRERGGLRHRILYNIVYPPGSTPPSGGPGPAGPGFGPNPPDHAQPFPDGPQPGPGPRGVQPWTPP